MNWLIDLFHGQGIPGTVLILALVTALGLALGSLKFRGLSLGIAGVLFAGLFFGHLGVHLDDHVLEFAREFGLILFVYTIGVQVGPGFLASLRRSGLPLNIMAAAIVLMGAALTFLISHYADVPLPAAVGLFSGATTNTPSLAAAQQALKDIFASNPTELENIIKLPGLGYAVAYPFGVLGIILVMILVRLCFRIQIPLEEKALNSSLQSNTPQLTRLNIQLTNPNLVGLPLQKIPLPDKSSIVISRIYHEGKLSVPQPETTLALNDVILAVGTAADLEQLKLIIGKDSNLDLRALPGTVLTKRIVVTHKAVLGQTLAQLDFVHRFGVVISRVSRAELEITPSPNFTLQYGDTVLAVGENDSLQQVASELGNSPKTLNHPQIIPVFVGIVLGVILGMCPFSIPGVPVPVKLGLAGGPLLVAIILSRIGRIGPLVWYLPISANFMLRELGITLFLACVGLRAGDQFIPTLIHGQGVYWMLLAALITLIPLLVIAAIARLFYKLNYLLLCGLLSGSMTDPPALAFAHQATGSDLPSVAYATVYPLTMLLRVLCAQLLVVFFMNS